MSLPYPSMTFVPLDVLTAEEMNQLVSNIEHLSNGTTLYENNSGQGLGNFSLSDSIENYDTIEIYFRNSDNVSGSTKVEISGSTASTTLQVILPGGGTDQAFYIFTSHVVFSETNGNQYSCKSGYFNNYQQLHVGTDSDAIKIYKVVGY